MDPAEIARSLGISPATVRVQLHKARLRLDREVGDLRPESTAKKRKVS
ncbi:sigma factor-like helix-turn-helix DNA-binding protein [Kitasatospora sp. NPDC058048]